jgi:hypothetical protein
MTDDVLIQEALARLNYGVVGLGLHPSREQYSLAWGTFRKLVMELGPTTPCIMGCVRFVSQRILYEYGELLDLRFGANRSRPRYPYDLIQIINSEPFFVGNAPDLQGALSQYFEQYQEKAQTIASRFVELCELRATLTGGLVLDQTCSAAAYLMDNDVKFIWTGGENWLAGASSAPDVLCDLGPYAVAALPALIRYYYKFSEWAKCRVVLVLAKMAHRSDPVSLLLRRAAKPTRVIFWRRETELSVLSKFAQVKIGEETEIAVTNLTHASHKAPKPISDIAIAALSRIGQYDFAKQGR